MYVRVTFSLCSKVELLVCISSDSTGLCVDDARLSTRQPPTNVLYSSVSIAAVRDGSGQTWLLRDVYLTLRARFPKRSIPDGKSDV